MPAPRLPTRDGRPAARLRIDARDQGPVLRYGDGPAQCDYLGAREAICFKAGDTYYLHYDGAGPTGWLACLAMSKDLKHWELKGPILELGAPGEKDSGTATSPWTVFDGEWWHMFYVASGKYHIASRPDLQRRITRLQPRAGIHTAHGSNNAMSFPSRPRQGPTIPKKPLPARS